MYICISVFGPESWTGMNFNDVTVWHQHLFWILDFDTFGFCNQIKLRNGSANSQAMLLQSLMARVSRYQDGMQNGCCQWKRTAIWPCCIGHRIRVWSTYLHLAVFMLTVKSSFTPNMDPSKVFSSDATIWVFWPSSRAPLQTPPFINWFFWFLWNVFTSIAVEFIT